MLTEEERIAELSALADADAECEARDAAEAQAILAERLNVLKEKAAVIAAGEVSSDDDLTVMLNVSLYTVTDTHGTRPRLDYTVRQDGLGENNVPSGMIRSLKLAIEELHRAEQNIIDYVRLGKQPMPYGWIGEDEDSNMPEIRSRVLHGFNWYPVIYRHDVPVSWCPDCGRTAALTHDLVHTVECPRRGEGELSDAVEGEIVDDTSTDLHSKWVEHLDEVGLLDDNKPVSPTPAIMPPKPPEAFENGSSSGHVQIKPAPIGDSVVADMFTRVPARSGYTSHGYPYGNPTGPAPKNKARCGGPKLCKKCRAEAEGPTEER